MKWCVDFPEEDILIKRPCLKKACCGNKAAAALLSYLLYQVSISQEYKRNAENSNKLKVIHGETPTQERTINIYRSQMEIIGEMDSEISDRTLRDTAIPLLVALGYIEVNDSEKINVYIIYLDRIQRGIQSPLPLTEILPILKHHVSTGSISERYQKYFRRLTEILPNVSEMAPAYRGNTSERKNRGQTAPQARSVDVSRAPKSNKNKYESTIREVERKADQESVSAKGFAAADAYFLNSFKEEDKKIPHRHQQQEAIKQEALPFAENNFSVINQVVYASTVLEEYRTENTNDYLDETSDIYYQETTIQASSWQIEDTLTAKSNVNMEPPVERTWPRTAKQDFDKYPIVYQENPTKRIRPLPRARRLLQTTFGDAMSEQYEEEAMSVEEPVKRPALPPVYEQHTEQAARPSHTTYIPAMRPTTEEEPQFNEETSPFDPAYVATIRKMADEVFLEESRQPFEPVKRPALPPVYTQYTEQATRPLHTAYIPATRPTTEEEPQSTEETPPFDPAYIAAIKQQADEIFREESKQPFAPVKRAATPPPVVYPPQSKQLARLSYPTNVPATRPTTEEEPQFNEETSPFDPAYIATIRKMADEVFLEESRQPFEPVKRPALPPVYTQYTEQATRPSYLTNAPAMRSATEEEPRFNEETSPFDPAYIAAIKQQADEIFREESKQPFAPGKRAATPPPVVYPQPDEQPVRSTHPANVPATRPLTNAAVQAMQENPPFDPAYIAAIKRQADKVFRAESIQPPEPFKRVPAGKTYSPEQQSIPPVQKPGAPVKNAQPEVIGKPGAVTRTGTEGAETSFQAGREADKQSIVPLRPPAATPLNDEVIVQLWEYLRSIRYSASERKTQLLAARELLALSLPVSLTIDLLEQVYLTFFDDFWRQKFHGIMNVSHLVQAEKSTGQIRIQRWLGMLQERNQLGILPPTRPDQLPKKKGMDGITFICLSDKEREEQIRERRYQREKHYTDLGLDRTTFMAMPVMERTILYEQRLEQQAAMRAAQAAQTEQTD